MSGHSWRQRASLPALMLAALFGSATFTSIAPFLNEMSADLGVSPGVTGQLTTVAAAAAAGAGIALAPFIRRLPLKRVLIAAIGLVGVFSVLTGLVRWFPALFGFQFIVGGASATAATAAILAVARACADADTRAKRQGLLIGALGCGALIGTPILRWVAASGGWQSALVAYGLFALAVALLVAFILPPLPGDCDGEQVSVLQRAREGALALRLPLIGPAVATSVLIWAGWGVLGGFLAGYFLDRYPGANAWIACIWFADGSAWLLGAFGSGYVIARTGDPARVVRVALLVMAVSIGVFAWAPLTPLLTLLAFAVWVGLLGLCTNALIAVYDRHGGEQTPAILFLDASLAKLGMVAGGLAGGLAIEVVGGYAGWAVLVVALSALAVAPLAWEARGYRRNRRTAASALPAARAAGYEARR